MNDPRTEEEKQEAHDLAEYLRKVAEVVENNRVLSRTFAMSQETEERQIGAFLTAHRANGIQQFEIDIEIYNPKADHRYDRKGKGKEKS